MPQNSESLVPGCQISVSEISVLTLSKFLKRDQFRLKKAEQLMCLVYLYGSSTILFCKSRFFWNEDMSIYQLVCIDN